MSEMYRAPEMKKSGKGCLFFASIGGIALVLIAVVAGVVFWKNYDTIISSAYARNIGGLFVLKSKLTREYRCSDVKLQVSMKPSAEDGRTLTVDLINSDVIGETVVGRDEEARVVARFALENFPASDDVGLIKVQFSKGTAGLVSVTTTKTYEIKRSELYDDEKPVEEPAAEVSDPAPPVE